MMPPYCFICDNKKDCGLIYFKKTLNQQIYELKCKIKRLLGKPPPVGHPDNAGWFCKKHLLLAEKYKNLTIKNAIKKIKEELKK